MPGQKGTVASGDGGAMATSDLTHPNGENPVTVSRSPKTETPPAQLVLGRTATFVAVGVLVVYIAALVLCFEHRTDANWDRIVYLLSGFEAIVFVAVGAIFGTTVQRTTVATAQAHAQEARADARVERNRADRAVDQGASGRALAASIRSFAPGRPKSAGVSAGAAESRHDAGVRGEEQVPADSDLSYLLQLADELFPRDR